MRLGKHDAAPITRETWRMANALLSQRERRSAVVVLLVMVLSAVSSAGMVASVYPFLTVLAVPASVDSKALFAWAYALSGAESKYEFLLLLGVMTVAVIIIANAVQILSSYVLNRFVMMRVHTISCRVLESFLRAPYEFYLTSNTGDMQKSVLAESMQAVNEFYRPAGDFVISTLTSLAVVFLLVAVEPRIAFACMLVLGGAYAATFIVSKGYVARIGRRRVRANGGRFRATSEALKGIREVKLLGLETSYLSSFARPSAIVARCQVRIRVVSEVPRYLIQAIAFGGAIVLCVALLEPDAVDSGATLKGILPTLGILAFAGQRLLPELQKAYAAASRLNYGVAAVESVYRAAIVGSDVIAEADHDAERVIEAKKSISLESITFSYPGTVRKALDSIDLDIRAGERIGIVGATGAGKTSLVDVLLGLLRAESGFVKVDGVVIDDGSIRAWQRSVAYVPQAIFLADASIAENIAIGLAYDEIDLERLERAISAAQLDGLIRRLDEGYRTQVGEQGVRLSGGERQRIGVARALYRDCALLVLDEATSALDSVTEKSLIEAINRLGRSRTTIMIAHRLSTLANCDRIVVMEGGRIVASGDWDVLYSQSAEFRELVSHAEAG